jgi:serralysin
MPVNSNARGLPLTTLDDLAGGVYRGKPIADLDRVVKQIDAGVEVSPHKGVITYAFRDSAHATGIYNNPKEGFTEQVGYSPFTEAQRAATRVGIQTWDELIAPSFKEVNGPGGADIVYSNTTTGPAQAWAYYPTNYGQPKYSHLASDVWVADPEVNASNGQVYPGGYGLTTTIHESGHALGLSHPGAYNFSDNFSVTYDNGAEYAQDSRQYSIMSYWDAYETGASSIDWSVMRFVYSSTPMVHDIYVIQQKYGADMTTRTGNTTYGFHATADVTNEAMRFHSGEMAAVFSIWDAGGKDTIDFSGYGTPTIIDLREGHYSSAGGTDRQLTLDEINANNAAAGLPARSASLYDVYFNGVDGVNGGDSWKEISGSKDYLMHENIGIAYGAVIENAVGGSGADVLVGNRVANTLTGNAGADRFVFQYDTSIDTITDFKSGVDKIDLSAIAGVDANDVSYSVGQHKLFVNTVGDAKYDMTIIVNGDSVNVAHDLIFA